MDDYRPRQFSLLPIAVKNILIINVIFYLASFVFDSVYHVDLSKFLGLYFPTNEHFHAWQFLTYLFMHASFDHLFFNMFSFWMFGSAIENFLGTRRFLIFYFFTGIGAALCNLAANYWSYYHIQQAAQVFLNHPTPAALSYFISSQHLNDFNNIISANRLPINHWLMNPDDSNLAQQIKVLASDYSLHLANVDERFAEVMIGASGAVYGVLFAYGYFFPNTLIYVYFFIPLKAKYFVLIFGAIEFFSAYRSVPGDNVAHVAHLGGMLFGFLLLYIRKNANKWRQRF